MFPKYFCSFEFQGIWPYITQQIYLSYQVCCNVRPTTRYICDYTSRLVLWSLQTWKRNDLQSLGCLFSDIIDVWGVSSPDYVTKIRTNFRRFDAVSKPKNEIKAGSRL